VLHRSVTIQTLGARPDYDKPPVVEVILGVQFEPVPKLSNPILAAFWKTFDQREWPTALETVLLQPQFERFGQEAGWANVIQFQISQDLSRRLQIKNKDGDRLMQFQNSRMHFNWMGQAGGTYPRYEKVRDGFTRAFKQFEKFVTSEELGEIRPNQWEVTYLNHIPRGTVWSSQKDWGFFLPLSGVPTLDNLIEGESFGGDWNFIIPDRRGRLHIQWQHVRQAQLENSEIIVLTLTARGPMDADKAGFPAIESGLDLGRETIVRSFEKLMSKDANQYWGLSHAKN
jgi:uncharacterized protein (TIGR04255 family)